MELKTKKAFVADVSRRCGDKWESRVGGQGQVRQPIFSFSNYPADLSAYRARIKRGVENANKSLSLTQSGAKRQVYSAGQNVCFGRRRRR